MNNASKNQNAKLSQRFRKLFTTRDFIFHDGRDLRRFSIAGRTQAMFASVAALTVMFSAYGVAQATVGAIAISGVAGPNLTPEAQMAQMREQVEQMQADVSAAKAAAKAHATRVERRQAIIVAVLSGKGDRKMLDQPLPATGPQTSAMTEEVLAPLRRIEQRQLALAAKAQAAGEARYAQTADHLRKLGINPDRYVSGAMGGPFEPIREEGEEVATADSDAQFRSLFYTWKKLDMLEQTVISVPSMQPVENLAFTSRYGVRSDPFRGTAAMHSGVDIPGPLGTPIFATADGIVTRSGRAGGYGNLIQINHGKGIETRYGHLSKILVPENARVRRGQMIGLMGSTGRSTGSHLHYEVRLDGRPVNPIPFLKSGEYLVAIQDRAQGVGGPTE